MKRILLTFLLLSTSFLFAQSAEKTPGCLDSLKIPSSFSPNADSVNDVFFINFPCEPEKFKIAIFNRWGVELFTSENTLFTWNATGKKGEEYPMGVYFYVVEFTYLGEEKTISGNVTVIR